MPEVGAENFDKAGKLMSPAGLRNGQELLWALSSHPDPATTGATPHKPYINPKRHLGFVEEERALQKKKARRKQFHATCRTYEFTYHATPLSLSLPLLPPPWLASLDIAACL